jgi:hypothetical protein
MVKIEFQSMSIDVLDIPIKRKIFKKKVEDLLQLIKNQGEDFRIHLENTRLKFDDKILNRKKYLSFYGIDNKSVVFCEKYRSMLICIQFNCTRTQDAITGVIDDSTRVKMSCGHYVKSLLYLINFK